MLSYQKALSLRHYRDGNYQKLSDLFNRRTKRRYPIPSVELSIHLLDSPGLKFGSFKPGFDILRNSQTIRGFIFSSDHLRCLSIRNDQDNPQSDLTWVPGFFLGCDVCGEKLHRPQPSRRRELAAKWVIIKA